MSEVTLHGLLGCATTIVLRAYTSTRVLNEEEESGSSSSIGRFGPNLLVNNSNNYWRCDIYDDRWKNYILLSTTAADVNHGVYCTSNPKKYGVHFEPKRRFRYPGWEDTHLSVLTRHVF